MALITIDADVSIDANTITFGVGAVCGVPISAGDACTIDSVTGLARPANNTDVFVGFAVKAAGIGRPVTLFKMGKIASYAALMIPGTQIWLAGAGDEGKLSDAPIVPTDPAVAIVVTPVD